MARTRPGQFRAPRVKRRPRPWFGLTGQTPQQLDTGVPEAKPRRPSAPAWQPWETEAYAEGFRGPMWSDNKKKSGWFLPDLIERGFGPKAGSGGPAAPAPAAEAPPSWQGDSRYLSDLSGLQSRRDLGLAGIFRQESDIDTNMKEALRRMTGVQQEALGDANRQYNRRGLLFSGALGKRRGDIEVDFARQRADTQGQARSALEELASRRAGLLGDYASGEEGARLDAADRQTDRDEAAAARNALVPVADPVPPPAESAVAVTPGMARKLPSGYQHWDIGQKRRYWKRRRAVRG